MFVFEKVSDMVETAGCIEENCEHQNKTKRDTLVGNGSVL